ncbi:MAG: DNA replication and repair protein RecF, partial [Lachnospiraceae bacterium]|nr:DNA replication and repair protein RecF [Lachnospiraceae bacterium]
KDLYYHPDLKDTLEVWDEQLVDYGTRIIRRRRRFVEELAPVIKDMHYHISGEKEQLSIAYEASASEEDFREKLWKAREKDERLAQTTVGPHRDDIRFAIDDVDIRRFGSQGQQRTCALSLKLSEIHLVRTGVGDTPVLLLDDVLSELDSTRQRYLLDSLNQTQTIMTCTGLDDFVRDRFSVNKVFEVIQGAVFEPAVPQAK